MSTKPDETIANDWPDASQFRRSIRLDFAAYVSAIILVLMSVTGYIISGQYVDSVTQGIVEKLIVQARSYSGPAGKLIISEDGPDALLLNSTCRKLAKDNPDVFWAGITGSDNKFIAHTDIKQVISEASLEMGSIRSFPSIIRPGESFEERSDTIFISVDIAEDNVLLGKLAIAASASSIAEARATSVKTVLSITLTMVFLGLPITMFLLHNKLQPISVIAKHLKDVTFDDISLNIPIRSKNELGYLAETLRVMGAKLNSAQKEMIERERINRELEIAREIQVNILPRGYPRSEAFSFAGTYKSAKEVGGDYYDFIELSGNRFGVLIADVSGKSLPGMLVMLITRDIVKRLSQNISEPNELLNEVNRELLQNIKKGMFVTMFYGVLDPASGSFVFASAGHNPLVHYSASEDECRLIKTKGYPLGMVPGDVFSKRIETAELNLAAGDWIVQYTDGITEAQNEKEEEYGVERVVSSIKRGAALDSAGIVDNVMDNVNAFVGDAPQYDDITLLVMKWNGVTADNESKCGAKVEYVS